MAPVDAPIDLRNADLDRRREILRWARSGAGNYDLLRVGVRALGKMHVSFVYPLWTVEVEEPTDPRRVPASSSARRAQFTDGDLRVCLLRMVEWWVGCAE